MLYPNDDDLRILFGKRIKYLRKKNKYSQSELSALTNKDKGSLQRIERGYNSTLKTFRKLSNAFEISLSELFNFDEITEEIIKNDSPKNF